MKKAELTFNVLRVPVDFTMLMSAGALTYVFRTQLLDAFRPVLFEFNLPLWKYMYLSTIVSMVFMLAYAVSGLYHIRGRMSIAEEFAKVIVASSAAIMGVIVFIFLRQELFDSRFLILGGWLSAIILVSAGRLLVRRALYYATAHFNFGMHKVMVIGDDPTSLAILVSLGQDSSSGYRVVKHLADPRVDEVKATVGNPGIDEIILANPNYPSREVLELVDFCHEQHIIFKYIPNIYQTLTTNFGVETIQNIPVIELRRTALAGWGKVFKRLIDIFISITALISAIPVLAATAFAIKWETAGPVFIKVKRVSKNREFDLFKFRSMIENAEELKPYLAIFNERSDGPLFKMADDPRVTNVGKFIRRLRIDELPQLFNVFRGDISLIGPRPHQPDEIARYEKRHKKVLAIKAGATGLAQISGSSSLSFEEEVQLDTFYIENWSLWLDTKIILKTIWKMLTDSSAV